VKILVNGVEVEWQSNRAGACDFCGVHLDWYASKFVEKLGKRICCAHSRLVHEGQVIYDGCGARDIRHERSQFWFYTDG
jgi:hypothetical protein